MLSGRSVVAGARGGLRGRVWIQHWHHAGDLDRIDGVGDEPGSGHPTDLSHPDDAGPGA